MLFSGIQSSVQIDCLVTHLMSNDGSKLLTRFDVKLINRHHVCCTFRLTCALENCVDAL